MKQIKLYKIGIDNYINKDDKNGGLYEFNLIKKASKMYRPRFNNILLIVNGKFVDDCEEENLLNTIKNTDALKIFIATDEICFINNNDIIRNCDVLLHQSPGNNYNEFKAAQYYSWIPELFYKKIDVPTSQVNKLFFGGGTRGNEAILDSLIADIDTYTLLKTDTKDNRIPYKDFQKLQSNFKYSFIISRPSYQSSGWVTPRFVEAISNYSFPIVHATYDKSNHYDYLYKYSCHEKVNSTDDVKKVMSYGNEGRLLMLKVMNNVLKKNMYNFVALLRYIDTTWRKV